MNAIGRGFAEGKSLEFLHFAPTHGQDAHATWHGLPARGWSLCIFCFIFGAYSRQDRRCVALGEGGDEPVAQGEASAKPWDHFTSDTKKPRRG
jgi:hypothetical protein